jgi:hypothetical protein
VALAALVMASASPARAANPSAVGPAVSTARTACDRAVCETVSTDVFGHLTDTGTAFPPGFTCGMFVMTIYTTQSGTITERSPIICSSRPMATFSVPFIFPGSGYAIAMQFTSPVTPGMPVIYMVIP